MSAELPSEMLTPEDVARITKHSLRAVAKWTGGRKKKPRLNVTRIDRKVLIAPESLIEFLIAHTVQAERPLSNGAQARFSEEDIQKICRQLEGFIEFRVKAEFAARDRKEHKTYPVGAVERNAA
jgi:hypothetical protein